MLRPADVVRIRQRVNVTAMWHRCACPRPADPARDTRSPLAPAGALIMVTAGEDGTEDLYRPTPFERLAIVDDLLGRRETALEQAGLIAPTKALLLAGGRVLECAIDRSEHDGLAGYHSRGLFDPFDVPGHDTWLTLARGPAGDDVLYAWIPREFVADADAGIWASATRCMRWVDEAELKA
ncbi:MAG TPA: hypothetical protein VK986_05745 [Tepidisphaeraceae bacterium]|nr:hypothetical protein [Tepidisphaeraceae bacterium]